MQDQQRLSDFAWKHVHREGFAPEVGEIAEALELEESAVEQLLVALEKTDPTLVDLIRLVTD